MYLQIQQMLKVRKYLGKRSTSLYSQNHGTTTKMYSTDAPELRNRRQEILKVPKKVQDGTLTNQKDKNTNGK